MHILDLVDKELALMDQNFDGIIDYGEIHTFMQNNANNVKPHAFVKEQAKKN